MILIDQFKDYYTNYDFIRDWFYVYNTSHVLLYIDFRIIKSNKFYKAHKAHKRNFNKHNITPH